MFLLPYIGPWVGGIIFSLSYFHRLRMAFKSYFSNVDRPRLLFG